MSRARHFIRNFALALLFFILSLALGLQTSVAQIQPSDMPKDLISPIVPYGQGIANILAQDAARPKAVQPILPGPSRLPNAPANSATNTPSAPIETPPAQK